MPPHIKLLLLYSTLVLPINYGVLAWGNSSKSQLETDSQLHKNE